MLTVIFGYAELLKNKLGPDTSLSAYVDGIMKAATRSSGLSRQLLIFGREKQLASQNVNVNTIVHDMRPLLERAIGEQIRLTVCLAPLIRDINADPAKIGQILMNLVVNARDAMPRGGELHLETANITLDAQHCAGRLGVVPGQYVLLSVTDSGRGIDPELQSRIFDPFFTTKEQGKGTGMGLAIVKSIVQDSGGYISVQSEPEEGSSFEIHFPVAQVPERRKDVSRPLSTAEERISS